MTDGPGREAREIIARELLAGGLHPENVAGGLLPAEEYASLIAGIAVAALGEAGFEVVRLEQVGWWGPYGLVPGGMDNDPAPHWQPLYRVISAAPVMTEEEA